MSAYDEVGKQLAEAQEKLKEKVSRAIRESLDETREATRPFLEELERTGYAAREAAQHLQEHCASIIWEFGESAKDFPQNTRHALAVLGQHGWYVDMEMVPADTFELAQAFESGAIAKAEQAIAEHYRSRTQDIAERLKQKFPHRARILGLAFAAHSRGEYELAILAFLSQADGVCQEMANGTQLFKKIRGKGVPQMYEYVEQLAADSITTALLHALEIPLPISASADQRRKIAEANALNRHAVLHGVSTDYGTELNSLKAISLLSYVCWVLGD